MTKRILSVILILIISLSIIVPALVANAAVIFTTSWDWNGDGNTEGWEKNDYISTDTVENGIYTLDITGGDAYITSPQLSFDASYYPKMELTYRNSTDCSDAEVFWTCSEGGWGPERGLGFSTIADGQWHTVTVDLSQNSYYAGTITQLRFDPVADTSGLFEIDKLRFIPRGENAAYWNFNAPGNFENWASNLIMDSCDVTDSSLVMKFSGQSDPWVENYCESIDTAIYSKLLLTYRNTTDCTTSEFYWQRTDEFWSADRMKRIETINDGDWHTVMVDLSTESNWCDTVKAIRFDPVEYVSGTFEIDRIVLASKYAQIDADTANVLSEVAWNFTNDNDAIGWTDCNSVSSTGVADGAIFFNLENSFDPFVCGPEIAIDASVYKKIEIRYRSTVDNNKAEIYWKKDNTDFNQEDHVFFELDNSGNWNNVIIDLSDKSNWSDIITGLRLDLAQSGTGFIEIDKIRFISEVDTNEKTCTAKGGDTTSWDFETQHDPLGWTINSGVADSGVGDGNFVMYISNGNDPTLTSPDISIDSKKYKIIEIKYKNEIQNDEGQIYWESNKSGLSEQNSCQFTSISDGVWHTIRLDMSQYPGWKGNITKLRVDPVTGGVGHFYIDRVAIMDSPSRYTMSNGYIYLSGVNGSVDTMYFDPNGTADYGENLLMGEMYMGMKYNDTTYSSSGSDVNWTIKDNTLTINNITFGSSKVKGKWVLTLDGNKLDNTFTITSKLDSTTTFYDLGYCYDMIWDNNGYDIEKDPVGSLRVPFRRIVSSDDRYHSAYAYKRMPCREDEVSIGYTGSYIDIEGANGHNYNLRMSCDTGSVSPICFVDHVKFNFRSQIYSVNVNPNTTLTRTLGIEVSQNKDVTPEHFVSFESDDEEFATSLTEMLYEFANARERGCTLPDWAEFISTIRAWQDDNYLPVEKRNISTAPQKEDGYVHTWGDLEGWPFPVDRDANHYITTCANTINAIYNYYVYDGDEEYLQNNIERLRLAMDYILKQFDPDYNLFRIDHPDHDGTAGSVGSNLWDILPYGNLSAYDNIYGYLALTRMAEIEETLGNTSRAEELNKYAADLKAAYNELFWAGDHFIQVIDVNGQIRDYGCVYINLETIAYGIADEERSKIILDYLSNTVTSSGEADVFSAFVFSPRASMFHNPSISEGGWYGCTWPGGDAFGTEQIQNGGTIFYTAYHELISRIKVYGADNSYNRFKEIIERYSIEHLQGGELATGEPHQHFTSGLVGCWGEFPENGLVPVAAKDGFMGISADMDGLNITPDMPSELSSLSVNRLNFRDMHLDITTTENSVRIKATKNDNKYDDWFINGKKVEGLFDVTVDIEKGETVSLYRASDKYELGDVDLDGEITIMDATSVQMYLAEKTEFVPEQIALADTNNDSVVSIMDATKIQMFVAQLIPSL
ncbi:MAG: hypothetical protein IJD93_09425 [Ruminococcus sp.]|nr:hypothetical protein [Ruminococcus sp.]MBQ2972161.1 hypothetical protein [Ruminococcus sp.]